MLIFKYLQLLFKLPLIVELLLTQSQYENVRERPTKSALNSGHQMGSIYNGRKGDEKGLGFPARNNSVKVIGFGTVSFFHPNRKPILIFSFKNCFITNC